MGYSQGVGGKDNSFPFQNTALPSAQTHFWCPQRISLPWLATSVIPPLIQAVRGLWSSDQKQDTRNFQETKFSFFKFFFSYVLQKREKKRGTTTWLWTVWGAQQPQPSALSEKCFPLKCSPCTCSSTGRRMNSSKQRRADEIKFIAWSQTPCPIQRSHKG